MRHHPKPSKADNRLESRKAHLLHRKHMDKTMRQSRKIARGKINNRKAWSNIDSGIPVIQIYDSVLGRTITIDHLSPFRTYVRLRTNKSGRYIQRAHLRNLHDLIGTALLVQEIDPRFQPKDHDKAVVWNSQYGRQLDEMYGKLGRFLTDSSLSTFTVK